MVAFFSQYPKITYNKRTIRDITIRLDFLSKIKNNVTLFQFTNLVDGERPEDIALKYYGDPELFWVVLFCNDIIDPYYDWLLTEARLNEYVVSKYGAENTTKIHHYQTSSESDYGSGVWCSSTEPFAQAITNYEYEKAENEKKRKIKILKNRYIQQVITEYKKELRNRD